MTIDRIYQYAKTQPEQLAIISDGQPVDYFRFAQGIECLRRAWEKHGLPHGSVAVVVSDNRLLGWSATLALQSLGLVTVGADVVISLLNLGLQRVSCTVMINTSREAVDAASAHWPDAVKLSLPHDFESALLDVVVPESTAFIQDGGHILYTSGTTGTYKKIFHDNALNDLRHATRMTKNGTEADSITNVSYFGPWTAVGYREPIFSWHCGATVVFDRRADWALHLGDHGVTRACLTPGQLQLAIQALNQGVLKAGPRWAFELLAGGGVTSASLIRLTLACMTPHLTLSFGCTEMWSPVMRTEAQGQDDDFWLRPMGVRDIDIVDERGASCPDMVEGLLRIRLQPTDYSGYLDDLESTSKVFREGWFYPGDLAVRRADGRMRVLGRMVDVINIRGSKVASAALEETLREGLGVTAVCTFSGLMADNEDRILIAVETAAPIAPERYQQLASQLLRGMGDIQFVQVNAFPRTQTGTLKIDRITLRRQIMAALQNR
ncbi:MAG: AMP-binding protein [Limnohabitans sp.]